MCIRDRPLHLDMTLTRAKFEDLIEDLVESTLDPVHKALKDAGLKKDDIDKVIMVGGSTRIPMVYDLVKKELGKDPSREVNPDEAVAMGAAKMCIRDRLRSHQQWCRTLLFCRS